jgi:hypothetical protein
VRRRIRNPWNKGTSGGSKIKSGLKEMHTEERIEGKNLCFCAAVAEEALLGKG